MVFNMNLNQIQQLIKSLAKKVEDDEKIATPILASKLAKCSEMYPHDQTIGAMSVIISKMASNQNMLISKGELRKLYNKLYSRNTKFAQLFEQEIGTVEELATPTVSVRDDSVELNPYEVADPVLANALDSVFSDAPLKMYSKVLANKALYSVSSTLDAWNLKPSSLEIENGNTNFIVIKANYETPKGKTSFYMPIQTSEDKVAEASVFIGNTGVQDLNHMNIKSYINVNAGAKLRVNGSNILETLMQATAGKREISNAELALTKLNATRQGKSEFFEGQIIGQKLAEASVKDVELPKYGEFESFEKQFTSPYGMASFKFGETKINIARENIIRELTSYGHKNPQAVVSGNNENTIFYSVALDNGKVAFTVPVKVINGKVNKPNVMVCNGTISSFDGNEINKLYVNNCTDYKAAAAASPLYALKASDVVNNIRTAMAEGNYSKAEDALNVLAESGDMKAYATGFGIYKNGLIGKKADECHCNMIIKNSTSEHPICGHTGLPIHKVYQDKDGNCRPLYRRGMDETYEGAMFMDAKIFG